MNAPNLALPAIPLDAIDGVPRDALPTAASRRRYAQTVALALLGRPCWEVDAWRRDLGEECPPLLRARAVAEDWPLTTIDQHGISLTILLRPVGLVDELERLIDEAIARMPKGLREAGRAVLGTLASGETPGSTVCDEAFGRVIFEAASGGHDAKASAFNEASGGPPAEDSR